MKINIRKIITAEFNIIIFFIFFSSLLVNTTCSSIFSIIKIGVILLLFFQTFCLYKKKISLNILGGSLTILTIYHILIGIYSIPDFLSIGIDGFMYYKQFFLFLISIYIFTYYRELTHHEYNYLFKQFIDIACLFIVTNILFYFINPPFIINGMNFKGRISVGYPTVDVIPMIYAINILYFYPQIIKNKFKYSIYFFILTIGIISQFTGSGTILLLFSLCLFFYYTIKHIKNKIYRNKFLLSVSFTVIIIIGSISIIKTKYADIFNVSLPIIENRINTLLGKDSDLNIDTQEIRNNQFTETYKYFIKDDIDKLFGVGFGYVSLDLNLLDQSYIPRYIFIENQYGFNLLTYGIIGNILFIFFFVCTLIQIYQLKAPSNKKLFCTVGTFIYIIISKNLCTLNIFPIFTCFSIVLAYINYMKKCSNITYYS